MATQMKLTLRVLAHLLRYPDAELRAHLDELRVALREERALSVTRLLELDALLDRLAGRTGVGGLRVEAEYVELFDRGRRTALNLFEHVHGDSRDRGPAMIDLAQTYERAGLVLAPGELPDALPVVLEFASTQPMQAGREFLRETVHIVHALFQALVERRSPYAAAMGAVLDLAGERSERVPAAALAPADASAGAAADAATLDADWTEPEAFGGCSTQGQQRADQPQPIHIVRPTRAAGAHARGQIA